MLDYAEGWPVASGLSGTTRFEGPGLGGTIGGASGTAAHSLTQAAGAGILSFDNPVHVLGDATFEELHNAVMAARARRLLVYRVYRSSSPITTNIRNHCVIQKGGTTSIETDATDHWPRAPRASSQRSSQGSA